MDWLNTRFAASGSLRPTAWEISATVPTPSTCESASTRKLRFPAEPTPAIAASPRRPTKYRSTRKYSVWNSMPAAIGTAIAMRCPRSGPWVRSFMRACYRTGRRMESTSGGRRERGGELDQLCAFRHLFADRDVEGLADPVRRRSERVLHLHRFQDQQRLAPRHARSGLDQQGHDAPGHDRPD